jgi:DNA-directed RNA polymerase subunit alpha
MPSEEHGTPEIGAIPLDSIFTPVVRANYDVEATRVGRRTDLDRIVLTVETNGTLTPEEAVEKAARILAAYFTQIFEPTFTEETGSMTMTPALEAGIEELDLPVRVVNALKKGGYKRMTDMGGITRDDLMKIKNLGEKSVDEIISQLAARGIEIK